MSRSRVPLGLRRGLGSRLQQPACSAAGGRLVPCLSRVAGAVELLHLRVQCVDPELSERLLPRAVPL